MKFYSVTIDGSEVFTHHNWVNTAELESETFKVPILENINALKKGDRVKICDGFERFYVEIQDTLVENGVLISAFAVITTELVRNLPYNYGTCIFVNPENIYEIITLEYFNQKVQEYTKTYTKEQLSHKLKTTSKSKIVGHSNN